MKNLLQDVVMLSKRAPEAGNADLIPGEVNYNRADRSQIPIPYLRIGKRAKMIPMARVGRAFGQIPMARVGRANSVPVRLTRRSFGQIPMARVGKRAVENQQDQDYNSLDYLDNLSRLWK